MPAVSELRQCGSIQLGQVGSSSATARSYSTVIASSRPAALSGSTFTAAHTSASRVAPNIWALLLTSWAILAAWTRSSSRSPAASACSRWGVSRRNEPASSTTRESSCRASRIPSTIDRSRQGPPGLGPSGPTALDGSLAADRLAEVVVHPGLEPAFAILREGAGGEGDDQLVGCRASPSRSAFATS